MELCGPASSNVTKKQTGASTANDAVQAMNAINTRATVDIR
jgi:hypothetical protein